MKEDELQDSRGQSPAAFCFFVWYDKSPGIEVKRLGLYYYVSHSLAVGIWMSYLTSKDLGFLR